MAAPAYRSSQHTGGATTNSIVTTKPAGTVNNDILLLWVYWESNAAVTITPPTNFAEVTACAFDNTGPNPDLHGRLYWKRASGEGADYTTGLSASVSCYATMASYSGAVTTGTPVEVGDKVTGNSTSCTLPSIITLTADTLIVGSAMSYDWVKTWSSSALTEHADSDGHAIYDAAQATAGASGTKLITQSGVDQFGGMICNLASTAGGGGAAPMPPPKIVRQAVTRAAYY